MPMMCLTCYVLVGFNACGVELLKTVPLCKKAMEIETC
jgi:hypothetical protein